MELRSIIAYNVRRLRVAKGVSQENLAIDASIDRTYMSRLERGIQNPTVDVLERLAKALDQPIIELLREPDGENLKIAPLRGGRRAKSSRS
jgi:transcriptional regulator with XRE-family HTH domain